MRQAYLIHGWGGNPNESWFPWLKEELKKRNISLEIPAMPNTDKPKISEWTDKIKETVRNPNKEVVLIGHSIGCQAIMRYLERLDNNLKIGEVIFVAGWFHLTEEVWDEEYTKEIAKSWLETLIDFKKVKEHANLFITINSNNDPYVPLEDVKIFEKKLNAKVIILEGKGHICEEHGIKEFPEILEFIK